MRKYKSMQANFEYIVQITYLDFPAHFSLKDYRSS